MARRSCRRGATAEGVELEWIEGDAEALPFGDATFDVVTSCFGAMFAPHHQTVADELVRVCRPGGTIGLMNFTPEGRGGEFFAVLAPYAPPPPPGAARPVLWGEEYHVRSLFGDRVTFRTLRRQSYVERAASPQAYCQLFIETFGPLVAIRANLSEPARAELDAALFDAVVRWNQGDARGPVSIPYEYLLMVGQRSNE